MTMDELKADFAVVFRCLQQERQMRERVLKGEKRAGKLREIDEAQAALTRMKDQLKEYIDADAYRQPELFNTPKNGAY